MSRYLCLVLAVSLAVFPSVASAGGFGPAQGGSGGGSSGPPNVSTATGTLPVVNGGTGDSAAVGAGGTLLASDGTKYAPVTVATVVSGAASGGWTSSSPTVTLTTSTNHVGIGTSPSGSQKLNVLGDATFTDIAIQAGVGGQITLWNGAHDTVAAMNATGFGFGGGVSNARFYNTGDFVVNDTGVPLPQNTTAGFFYVPRVLTGAPSGVPDSYAGAAAMIVGGDHHLYAELTSGSFTQVDGGGSMPTLQQAYTAGGASGGGITTTASGGGISVTSPVGFSGNCFTAINQHATSVGYAASLLDTTSTAFEAKVTSEASYRFQAFTDGRLAWGDGTNPVDVSLWRSGAGVLKCGDGGANGNGLMVAAEFISLTPNSSTFGFFVRSPTAATDLAFGSQLSGAGNYAWLQRISGKTEYSDGTAGTDLSTERGAAGTLFVGNGTTGSFAGTVKLSGISTGSGTLTLTTNAVTTGASTALMTNAPGTTVQWLPITVNGQAGWIPFVH